jgi:hypothetical protein
MAFGLKSTSRRRWANVGSGAGTDWRGNAFCDEVMVRS